MRPLRLGITCPTAKDYTSLCRGMGPWGKIAKNSDLKLVHLDDVSWVPMWMLDAYFLQRPYMDNHVKMAKIASLNRVPIWLDYDDDLFSLPEDNPAFEQYMNQNAQRNLLSVLKMADLVTVTTHFLKLKIENRCIEAKFDPPHVVVVPNAYNDENFGPIEFRPEIEGRPPLVFWRGSATHVKDVALHAGTIVGVNKTLPDVFFAYMGWNPWMLTDAVSRGHLIHVPPIDPMEYMNTVRDIRATLWQVPLAPCEFNLAKSNLAWVEATACSMPVLAPNWPEWQRPGVTLFEAGNPADMGKAMLTMLAMRPEQREELVRESQEFVRKNLMLSHVNQSRIELLEKLVDGSVRRKGSVTEDRNPTAAAIDKQIRKALKVGDSLQDPGK